MTCRGRRVDSGSFPQLIGARGILQLPVSRRSFLNTDFYDHPDLYDALLPVGAHLPFYAGLARQQGGSVLEVACGTGRITIPIALNGHPTTGLDRSRAMLDSAAARASAANAPVAFVQGDMRDFALGRHFDLIFVARNSLLHLLSTEDLLAAFAAIRRHLAPNGLFAFDIFNPDPRLLATPAGQRFPVMEASTPQFGALSVEQTSDYDSATQVNHATWYISTHDQRDAWVVPLVLRSIFPNELPLLLSAAGLELTSRFGELSGAPFGRGSRIQLCLCRRV
jgi:SAM-dependent methyltransferase